MKKNHDKFYPEADTNNPCEIKEHGLPTSVKAFVAFLLILAVMFMVGALPNSNPATDEPDAAIQVDTSDGVRQDLVRPTNEPLESVRPTNGDPDENPRQYMPRPVPKETSEPAGEGESRPSENPNTGSEPSEEEPPVQHQLTISHWVYNDQGERTTEFLRESIMLYPGEKHEIVTREDLAAENSEVDTEGCTALCNYGSIITMGDENMKVVVEYYPYWCVRFLVINYVDQAGNTLLPSITYTATRSEYGFGYHRFLSPRIVGLRPKIDEIEENMFRRSPDDERTWVFTVIYYPDSENSNRTVA